MINSELESVVYNGDPDHTYPGTTPAIVSFNELCIHNKNRNILSNLINSDQGASIWASLVLRENPCWWHWKMWHCLPGQLVHRPVWNPPTFSGPLEQTKNLRILPSGRPILHGLKCFAKRCHLATRGVRDRLEMYSWESVLFSDFETSNLGQAGGYGFITDLLLQLPLV